MITNFEEITKPLTAEELKLVPIIIQGMKEHPKSKPINTGQICEQLNAKRKKLNLNNKVSGPVVRKVINHIRRNSMFPIIGSGRKGYYFSFNPTELHRAVKSLRERAAGINIAAAGMEKILKEVQRGQQTNFLK